MKRCATTLAVVVLWCSLAGAQGFVGDLLSGKLVKPKVGQWVWYDLTDNVRGKHYVLRQAIVGKERVGRKTGYWVEFEVVPEVGYRLIYKMLLTGPASDPDNIHRVLRKDGPEPVEEVAIEHRKEPKPERPKRESKGMEEVETLSGPIRAEHYEVTKGSRTLDVWVNEDIKPSGIVRMRSREGEMLLRTHGFGGESAKSAIDAALAESEARNRPSVSAGEEP